MMTKKEYLKQLEKALKRNGVPDIDDIINEYSQHFDCKIAEGHSEEEIAAKLEAPSEIAVQFNLNEDEVHSTPKKSSATKWIINCIMPILSIVNFSFVISMVCYGICAVASSIAVLLSGLAIVVGNIFPLPHGLSVPTMPIAASILICISLIAFAVLLFLSGIIIFKLGIHFFAAFYRFWYNSVSSNPKGKLNFPRFKEKTKKVMSITAIVAALIFLLFSIAAYIYLASFTGSIEFWHALGWFEKKVLY